MRKEINILTWNMNGIKQKILSIEVLSLFENNDIVIICESHLGVRSKCPDGFVLTCRSKVLESKRPRGGVAVYRNIKKTYMLI